GCDLHDAVTAVGRRVYRAPRINRYPSQAGRRITLFAGQLLVAVLHNDGADKRCERAVHLHLQDRAGTGDIKISIRAGCQASDSIILLDHLFKVRGEPRSLPIGGDSSDAAFPASSIQEAKGVVEVSVPPDCDGSTAFGNEQRRFDAVWRDS